MIVGNPLPEDIWSEFRVIPKMKTVLSETSPYPPHESVHHNSRDTNGYSYRDVNQPHASTLPTRLEIDGNADVFWSQPLGLRGPIPIESGCRYGLNFTKTPQSNTKNCLSQNSTTNTNLLSLLSSQISGGRSCLRVPIYIPHSPSYTGNRGSSPCHLILVV
jgi:hypothetical protein